MFVYELALDLVAQIQLVLDAGGTRFHMKDQLDRTATAIAMALAHVHEEPPSRRWHRYRAALRYASTLTTLLDIVDRQGVDVGKPRRVAHQLRTELVPLAHGH